MFHRFSSRCEGKRILHTLPIGLTSIVADMAPTGPGADAWGRVLLLSVWGLMLQGFLGLCRCSQQ